MAAAAAALPAPPAAAHPESCQSSDEHADHAHDEGCLTAAESGHGSTDLGTGEIASTRNTRLVANVPKSGPFASEPAFMSDLAFWGDYAFQGNYEGFQVLDVSTPHAPRLVSQVDCPGAQNDVSVWQNLVFTSTDSSRAFPECYRNGVRNFARAATAPSDQTWEGIRVFDWTNPAAPQYLTAVETDCGSHTHTLVPDEANGRVLLYVSSYGPAANTPDCQPPHDKISIVSVPLANPRAAHVLREDVLFPDGGFPGSPTTRATAGCHDITVFPEKDLAAGACMGEGVIIDISNRADPRVVSSIVDPNFAFWHSATFSNDATKVIFTDELGGGSGATCNAAIGPVRGADAIYDISDPERPVFLSYFKIPRQQGSTENCVAHNGAVLPLADRDVFVQAWYQGGVSVIDFTDGRNPREVAYFDRGPLSTERAVLGGSWSAYWYKGLIFSSDIQKGLDVLRVADDAVAGTQRARTTHLNVQTQYAPRLDGPR